MVLNRGVSMSTYESSITNPKKQLEFYKDLSEQLQQENQSLKKQLEEINKIIEKCGFVNIEQVMLNYCGLLTQQKEFIEYMNKTIEELEYDDVDDEKMKGYLIQRIDTFKEILSKYKSIIGGKDAIK